MNEEILSIHDRNDQSPVIYCDMKIKEPNYEIYDLTIDLNTCIEASKRVYACLNQKKEMDHKDMEAYLLLKKYIQNEIQRRMNYGN